MPLSKTGSYT
ncbi:hypothetical protein F383_38378 [Gossypium arboreum]|uniref:Uncharacterized protein n=1 Tax=Gossypium arboreum TaxID=29729 RepID=A0A0B0MK85_GOSAR|nr:hypothetical protein F383_38378 [Gossypium arboreum]